MAAWLEAKPGCCGSRASREYTDLIRFDGYSHDGDTWPLLHITQAGRDHIEKFRGAYAEHHPDIVPPQAAAAAGASR